MPQNYVCYSYEDTHLQNKNNFSIINIFNSCLNWLTSCANCVILRGSALNDVIPEKYTSFH
jgi:hypothetical protein